MFAEYCGVRWRQDPSLEAELRFVFDEADTDCSGDLSKEEIEHLLRKFGLLGPKHGQNPASTLEASKKSLSMSKLVRKLREGMSDLLSSLRLLRRQAMLAFRLIRHERLHGELSQQQRAVVRRSMRELGKMVPFLFVYCLPGGTALIAGMVAVFPSTLPIAFQKMFAKGTPNADASSKAQSVSEFDVLCVETFGGFLRSTRAKLAEQRAAHKS